MSEKPKPIDMVLICPRCGNPHVDAPEPGSAWTNPPHTSHLCHSCGMIFRPADVPTNGVQALRTRGKADTDRGHVLSSPYEGTEFRAAAEVMKRLEFHGSAAAFVRTRGREELEILATAFAKLFAVDPFADVDG